MTRYLWVASRKAEGFPTKAACQADGVSRQAFYDWSGRRAQRPSPAELADAELVDAIKQIHAGSGGAYGSPRVTAELRRQGRRVNRKRVCRLMRLHGICGIHKRRKPRFGPVGGARSTPSDLVRRDFRPGRPRRGVSGRHHLHPHRPGVVAPRRRVGSRVQTGHRLLNGRRHGGPVGGRRPRHGRRIQRRPHRRGDIPLRPRPAIPQRRLRLGAGPPQNAPIRRPGSQLLGQQRRRIVLLIVETRTRHTNPVRDPRPSPPGDLRLDRPLQHTQNPLHPQLSDPHRMGEQPTATTTPSRINYMSTKQGEAQSSLSAQIRTTRSNLL